MGQDAFQLRAEIVVGHGHIERRAPLYLDELLRSAAEEADVSLSRACRDLDAGAFYTALTQPQDTAQTGDDTSGTGAESDPSAQESGT